jgi:hypothetical protein
MVNAIQNRFNWQSRKTRALVAAAVCAAGLGIGFGGGMIPGSEPPPPSYCLYDIPGTPPPGCNAFYPCDGGYFYKTSCPSDGGPCTNTLQVCGLLVQNVMPNDACSNTTCPGL